MKRGKSKRALDFAHMLHMYGIFIYIYVYNV